MPAAPASLPVTAAALPRSRGTAGTLELDRPARPAWRPEASLPTAPLDARAAQRVHAAPPAAMPGTELWVKLLAGGDHSAAAAWGQALALEGIAVQGLVAGAAAPALASPRPGPFGALGALDAFHPMAHAEEAGGAAGALAGLDEPIGRHSTLPCLVVLHVAEALAPRLAELRAWRSRSTQLPLVVVVRGLRDLDQVLALEMGADDVIDAAVAAPVVAARLRALWRRALAAAAETSREAEPPRELRFGTLRLRRLEREVLLANAPVPLTEGEFEVLWLLASHAGQALSRRDILKRVRGLDDQPLDRSIDSRVYRIRAKLGDSRANPPRIRTVRHQGYAFSPNGW